MLTSQNPPIRFRADARRSALLAGLLSAVSVLTPALASEDIHRLEFQDDRVLYVSRSAWQLRTRWYDVLPSGDKRFIMFNPGSSKYFTFKKAADLPSFIIIPSSHLPQVIPKTGKGAGWSRAGEKTCKRLKVRIYRRRVVVRFQRFHKTFREDGLEEVWIASDIEAPASLLKFLAQYYGCPSPNGLPVRHILTARGLPAALGQHTLGLSAEKKAKPWPNFGKLPANARPTRDFVQVVTGSDGGLLDFLYRDVGGSKKKKKKKAK